MPITIQDIFEAIPRRFNSDAAGAWNAIIQFDFSGDDTESWLVNVDNGSCTVETGTSDAATANVKTSTDTWIGMITGSVNPMQAFMSGQLVVGGNVGDVMKLQDKSIFPRD